MIFNYKLTFISQICFFLSLLKSWYQWNRYLFQLTNSTVSTNLLSQGRKFNIKHRSQEIRTWCLYTILKKEQEERGWEEQYEKEGEELKQKMRERKWKREISSEVLLYSCKSISRAILGTLSIWFGKKLLPLFFYWVSHSISLSSSNRVIPNVSNNHHGFYYSIYLNSILLTNFYLVQVVLRI